MTTFTFTVSWTALGIVLLFVSALFYGASGFSAGTKPERGDFVVLFISGIIIMVMGIVLMLVWK